MRTELHQEGNSAGEEGREGDSLSHAVEGPAAGEGGPEEEVDWDGSGAMTARATSAAPAGILGTRPKRRPRGTPVPLRAPAKQKIIHTTTAERRRDTRSAPPATRVAKEMGPRARLMADLAVSWDALSPAGTWCAPPGLAGPSVGQSAA